MIGWYYIIIVLARLGELESKRKEGETKVTIQCCVNFFFFLNLF